MLHKIKLLGTVVLILLGFILFVGYPKGGVKNIRTYSPKKITVIPTLTKEGNAKNFSVKIKKVPNAKTHRKTENNDSNIHTTYKKKIERKVQHVQAKKKPVPVIQKPIKKKIKLIPPQPSKEEEEDEGC